MNYLSSSNYFCIKNLISNSFNHFITSLDWGSFKQEHRGLGIRIQRPSAQLSMDDGLIVRKSRVSFAIVSNRTGINYSQPPDSKSRAKVRSTQYTNGYGIEATGSRSDGPGCVHPHGTKIRSGSLNKNPTANTFTHCSIYP